jgi:hypothetical protein
LSFEEAINKENERIKENIFKGYIKRSIYIEQVKRYLELFPKKNMHFILMEELISNPKNTLEQLLLFLKVEPTIDENIMLVKKNQTASSEVKVDRFPWISQRLNQYFPRQHILHKVNRKLNSKFIKPSPIDPDTKKRLQEYFKDFNSELSKVIEKDLSLWKT